MSEFTNKHIISTTDLGEYLIVSQNMNMLYQPVGSNNFLEEGGIRSYLFGNSFLY